MENRKIQKMLVCCILLGVLCGLVSGCSETPEVIAKNSFSILDVLEFAGGHLGDGSYLLISGSKVAGMDSSSLEGYKAIEYITEKSVTLQSDDESKVIYLQVMFDISEINGLLYTDKTYFVLDKITY